MQRGEDCSSLPHHLHKVVYLPVFQFSFELIRRNVECVVYSDLYIMGKKD